MAATVRADYYGGSAGEPAGVSAETGIVYSLSDAQAPASGTAPISKPAGAGTAFSYIMLLALNVTASAATSLFNRTIAFGSVVTSGSTVFFADQPTYRQPSGGNHPAPDGSDGPATPSPAGGGAPGSYAEITTTPQGWDASSVSAGVTGRNGDFVELVFGVDSTYAGGSGRETLPDHSLAYDEA